MTDDGPRYVIAAGDGSDKPRRMDLDVDDGFQCPRCGRTSQHPTDKREGYCGFCHDFTDDPDREGWQ